MMHDMVKNGVLQIKNNRFVCGGEYEKALDYIRYASEVVRIRLKGERETACIGYMGERIMAVRLSKNNKNNMLIRWKKREEFAEYLREEGDFECLWEEEPEQEQKFQTENTRLVLERIYLPEQQIVRKLSVQVRNSRYRILYHDGTRDIDSGELGELPQFIGYLLSEKE